MKPSNEEFEFEAETPVSRVGWLFGVTRASTRLAICDGQLIVGFGPWSLRTPIANIRYASVTGPFKWWKVAGPARYSIADWGVTFATTTRRGVCIEFDHPVRAIEPTGTLRHPNATITVADPEEFLAALRRGGVRTAEHPGEQIPTLGP